jgi:integrase
VTSAEISGADETARRRGDGGLEAIDGGTPAWTDADHEIGDETRAAIKAGVAANTTRAYARQWSAFGAWCTERARTALPATDASLAEYAAWLCRADYAPSTVEQAVAAIRVAHRTAGYPGRPDTTAVELILAGHRDARAQDGKRAKQAKVLDIKEIRRMLTCCDLTTLPGLRDRVIIALGANLMSRRSELHQLDLHDLEFTTEGLLVYVRKSKTDQQARGRKVAVPAGVHADSDPVRLTSAWIEALAGHEITSGPLLRACGRGGRLQGSGRLTPEVVNHVVRRRARQAGIPAWGTVSAHSLRATGATLAAWNDVPAGVIAEHGGWKPTSPTVHGYMRTANQWKNNAMRGTGF